MVNHNESRPMLLPPGMLKQYADRARKGDYQYHLKPDIYVWFVGFQAITVFINGDAQSGHVTKRTASQLEADKLSMAAAVRRQAERNKGAVTL
jgi:hypothetical protein